MSKNKRLSEIKQQVKEDIKNSQKLFDTISNIEVGNNYITNELKAKRSLINKPVVKFNKKTYIKTIDKREQNRIASLPAFLNDNKKEEHIDYDVKLFFEYKEQLSELYMKDKILKVNMEDLEHLSFIVKFTGWNQFTTPNTFVETFNNNLENYIDTKFYTYVVAMTILSHMALVEDLSEDNLKNEYYNFDPLGKKVPENPNVNLSKRMLSCDLYYYSAGVPELYEKMKINESYMNWLLDNAHLSFEKKFNKGIDFWIEKNKSEKPITMKEFTRKKFPSPQRIANIKDKIFWISVSVVGVGIISAIII